MIKTALIYLLIDHCIDLLDKKLTTTYSAPPNPLEGLQIGYIYLIALKDGERLIGAYRGEERGLYCFDMFDEGGWQALPVTEKEVLTVEQVNVSGNDHLDEEELAIIDELMENGQVENADDDDDDEYEDEDEDEDYDDEK